MNVQKMYIKFLHIYKNIQTAEKPYILYFLNFRIYNDVSFRSILPLCKISGTIFPY